MDLSSIQLGDIMNKTDTVKNMLQELASDNPWNAGTYLTDDFTFSGPVPTPVGKTEFLEFHAGLKKGFPDWQFNLKDVQEKGGLVTGAVQIRCTHTAALTLPGLPTVAATGKKIQLPREAFTCSFEGNRISEFKVDKVASGGIQGIYAQLGVNLPQATFQLAR